MHSVQMTVGIEVSKIEINLKENSLVAHARALLNHTETPLQSHNFSARMPVSPELHRYLVQNVEKYMAHNIPMSDRVTAHELEIIKKIRAGTNVTNEEIEKVCMDFELRKE